MALDRIAHPPRRGWRRRTVAELVTYADRSRDAREWKEAARLYREALERDPDNPPVWVQYGHALKESGELNHPDKLAQAEIAYRRAQSLDPRAADTYLQLGHVLKLQGKTNEAEASYLRAFALDPSIPYPLQELSRLGWSETQTAELRGLIAFSRPPAQTGEIQWLPATPSGSPSESLEGNIRAIRESGLFDEAYYRANNTDLPAGIDPVGHFLQWGAREGRNPHELFDVRFYETRGGHWHTRSPDPVTDYLRFGAVKGVDPHPLFATIYYLQFNPDVAESVAAGRMNPLVHFLEHGGFEGRNPHPLFHLAFYLEHYPDVTASGLNPAVHYVLQGGREQRICNPAGHSPFDNYGLLPGEPPDHAGILESFPYHPLISVVMPLYATKEIDERVLVDAIRSIQAQTYDNWEICICNNGSTFQPAIRALNNLRQREPRIRVVEFDVNRGISAATNAALGLAQGEFIALMDHDDMLTANALYEVVKAINNCPAADVLYSDQDKIDLENNRSEPFHKPDWSPEMFRGVMYVGHLLVARRSLLTRVGGLDSRFDKIQDYELMLRLGETTSRIFHIPKILYHWRMIPGSLAFGSNEKSNIGNLQMAAVTAHLARLGVRAEAVANDKWPHRVKILPDGLRHRPKISIVIARENVSEGIGRCLDSIFTRSSYNNYEVIVLHNGIRDSAAEEILLGYPIVHCIFEEPRNFSRANNLGVARSSGEYLVFLDNHTEVVTTDWLENMLFYFLEYDDLGIVAPLLTSPDGQVRHAGMTLRSGSVADHVMRCCPAGADGYGGSLCCAREVTAVTADCLLMPRHLFDELGGFVEELVSQYQDLDLCLRVRRRGLRILFTPRSWLLHNKSVSRSNSCDHLDRGLIADVWREAIDKGDPYYNVNFDRKFVDYTVYRSVISPWRL